MIVNDGLLLRGITHRKRAGNVVAAVMRSHARLTYTQVWKAVPGTLA